MTDARRLRREKDQIHKNFHMIDFHLYSMEILCHQIINGSCLCDHMDRECEFKGKTICKGIPPLCMARAMRRIIGHPFDQQDVEQP